MSTNNARKRRQRRAVLSEEEYQSTLQQVVERDYYPSLPGLRKDVAVMERRAAGDFPGAVRVRRAARLIQQHEESCAEQEEMDDRNLVSGNTRKRPRPLHRESLTGFHARVTSEDNADFEETQQEEVKEHRQRLQQVFSSTSASLRLTNGSSSTATTRTRSVGAETPLLMASDQFTAPAHRPQSNRDTRKPMNGFFFTPEHHSSPHSSVVTSPALLLTTATRNDRQLMPPPARILTQTPDDNNNDAMVVRKRDLVEYQPKTLKEKKIEPTNTRFSVPILVPPSRPRVSGGDSSTEYSTDATTDLDEPVTKSLSQERRSYLKRQRREQETLVQMTPVIIPGSGGARRASGGNESPIVTWGTVEGTPLVLSGNAPPQEQTFSLPAESSRDRAAQRAHAKLETALKKKKQTSSSRQQRRSSQTPLDRATANLTPAAQSLFRQVNRTPRLDASVRSSSSLSVALRHSYTPQRASSSTRKSKSRSVQRTAGAAATPRRRVPSSSTAAGVPTTTSSSSRGSTTHITDGLLQLDRT